MTMLEKQIELQTLRMTRSPSNTTTEPPTLSSAPAVVSHSPSVIDEMENLRRSVLEFLSTWKYGKYTPKLQSKAMIKCLTDNNIVKGLHAMIRGNRTLNDDVFVSFIDGI